MNRPNDLRPPPAAARHSLYQPEQEGLAFPQEPVFESFEQQRRHRKERLAAACRAFSLHGFDFGFAGHLTVRDPERPELYWTNPVAVHFSRVKVSNLVLADHRGRVLEGRYAINQAGFVLHSAVHEEHPDIVAMCHAHTQYGSAFASLGRPLAPITQDAAMFFEDHVVIGDEAGHVAVEVPAGKKIAGAFKGVRAAIHRNHGLFTVSRHSIDAAAFWMIALERVCQQQLLVGAQTTDPILVAPEDARYSRRHVGSEYIAWLAFQPEWELLRETQPDLLS
ncbi:MAG: class II aldolase/adducin family protein [Lautropia sp.]